MPDPTYDVFMSVSGVDRQQGRVLTAELRGLGLRVFLDEDDIEPFTGITGGIWNALAASKCLVAYYSAAYAVRPSCQLELMAAYLAGQRIGDPCQRIMVVNPEQETRHLRPVELADAKFASLSLGTAEIARIVAKRVSAIELPIGPVQPPRPPALPARLSGHVRKLAGRYAELWDLHTALFATDYSMIDESACGPFSSVHGLPGIGKTSLVATYAWRFAAAYPGGVSWLTLSGADVSSASHVLRERYVRELRRVARDHGVAVDVIPDSRIVAATALALRNARAATLWVVDDIPCGVDAEALLDSLPLVADCGARTVLITDQNIFGDLLPTVHVGGLPKADAVSVLDRYLSPANELDAIARDEIIDGLGGHPAALAATGRYFRDLAGLVSYSSAIADARHEQHLADIAFNWIRPVIDQLSTSELTLLRLVAELTGFSFSIRQLAALSLVADIDLPATLAALSTRGVVSQTGKSWRFEPLVVGSMRELRPAAVTW